MENGVLKTLYLLLPEWAKELAIHISNLMRSILYRGKGRWCLCVERNHGSWGFGFLAVKGI